MRLLEASDLPVRPTIFPSVIVFSGLGCPKMLGERHSGRRISVAVAQLKIGIRPDPGVDELCVVLSRTCGRGKDGDKTEIDGDQSFHFLSFSQ